MSNIIGHTKDLDASRAEALQGLLSSLGHRAGDTSSADSTLSPEQLQKLSQKINDILGDISDRGAAPGDQPSQLRNEDGLPIIDISEPVDEALQSTSTLSSPVVEQDLIPLSLLSADEKERRRRERDRILDLLEEEEHFQQLQEERDAEEERREAIRKRKESVKAELDQLKAARELYKKMGRALVQRADGAKEKTEEDMQSKPQTSSAIAKKSVSFADAPVTEANEGKTAIAHQSDWGDVVPGRLRTQGRLPLVSTSQAEEYPMKMHVVERHPAGTPASPFHPADSDDESTPSPVNLSPSVDNDSPEEDVSPSSNSISDDEPLEEGFDYDAAQHHREIALEYHKKRHAIGTETAKAMAGDFLDDSEHQGASNGQSPLSRFRADRMAAAYDKSRGPISTSIEHSVIPASRQKSLQSSVRLGKLEKGQLVGGHSGESGSEDENVRELIQMLQTGSIQNAGPDFDPSSISTITSPHSDAREPSFVDSASTSRETRPSKFKLARGGEHTETATHQGNHTSDDNYQSRSAVSRVIERKAPRSNPSRHFPVNKPPPRSPTQIAGSTTSMIIDSPSFPMPDSGSIATIPSSSPNSMSTGSPSHNVTRLERPPTVKLSAMQDSTTQSRVSSSAERPISRFIAERKK